MFLIFIIKADSRSTNEVKVISWKRVSNGDILLFNKDFNLYLSIFFFFLVRGLKGKRPQGLLKNINETRAGLFHIPTIL